MTTATWERSESVGMPVPRAAKGLTLVIFWVIALVLWIIAPGVTYAPAGAFVVDTGLVLAFMSFGMLYVETMSGFYRGLAFTIVGIILFAIGDLTQSIVLVYFLRMFIPLLCLLMPLNRFANNFRVFS